MCPGTRRRSRALESFSLDFLQPVHHVHLAVQRRSDREVLERLPALTRSPIDPAEAVAVGDEGAHTTGLGECECVEMVRLAALRVEAVGTGRDLTEQMPGMRGEPAWYGVEVKANPSQVERMAKVIDTYRELEKMPSRVAKEIEYVLDIQPRYFWLVGPGTVDPERHVWRIQADSLRAGFSGVASLPPAP